MVGQAADCSQGATATGNLALLVGASRYSKEDVRARAVTELQKIQPSLSEEGRRECSSLIDDMAVNDRSARVRQLAQLACASPHVLAAGMSDQSARVRIAALQAATGISARLATPELLHAGLEALASDDPQEAKAARRALQHFLHVCSSQESCVRAAYDAARSGRTAAGEPLGNLERLLVVLMASDQEPGLLERVLTAALEPLDAEGRAFLHVNDITRFCDECAKSSSALGFTAATGLLSAAEAALWARVCQHLCDQAAALAQQAASSSGVAATSFCERAAACNCAVDAIMGAPLDLLDAIQAHVDGGALRAAGYMMCSAAACMDFADAAVQQRAMQLLVGVQHGHETGRSQVLEAAWVRLLLACAPNKRSAIDTGMALCAEAAEAAGGVSVGVLAAMESMLGHVPAGTLVLEDLLQMRLRGESLPVALCSCMRSPGLQAAAVCAALQVCRVSGCSAHEARRPEGREGQLLQIKELLQPAVTAIEALVDPTQPQIEQTPDDELMGMMRCACGLVLSEAHAGATDCSGPLLSRLVAAILAADAIAARPALSAIVGCFLEILSGKPDGASLLCTSLRSAVRVVAAAARGGAAPAGAAVACLRLVVPYVCKVLEVASAEAVTQRHGDASQLSMEVEDVLNEVEEDSPGRKGGNKEVRALQNALQSALERCGGAA